MKLRIPRAKTIVVLVALVAVIVRMRCPKEMRQLILRGEHGYTQHAGWVNWRHANPQCAAQLLTDMEGQMKAARGAPFSLCYRQCMSGVYLGVKVETSVEHDYLISDVSDTADLHRAAWIVFKNVSEDFERAQETLPDSLIAESSQSGCRDGDLMGNLIGFQRARLGLSLDAIRAMVVPLPPQRAAQMWASGQQAKNRSWQSQGWLGAVTLPPLIEPPKIPDGWAEAHVQFLRRERRSFRLSRG